MSYIKRTWIQRLGDTLNRFAKSDETSTHVTLTNDPVSVSTEGTFFTAEAMNHIENGIETNDVSIRNHVANTSNPHSVSKEQITGLKETDTPEFANITVNKRSLLFVPDSKANKTVKSLYDDLRSVAMINDNLTVATSDGDVIIKRGFTAGNDTTLDISSQVTYFTSLLFDGTNLMGFRDNILYIYNGISNTLLNTIIFIHTLDSICYDSYTGNLISIRDGVISIYDGISNVVLNTFSIDTTDYCSISVDPKSRVLYVTNMVLDGNIYLYGLDTQELIIKTSIDYVTGVQSVYQEGAYFYLLDSESNVGRHILIATGV